MKWIYALGLAALLSGCPQSNSPQGNSPAGGQARVLSSVSEPNLSTCPVIRSDYIIIKGENFGVAADWISGTNKVIFFDNVTVPAADAELTQADNPATLLVKVPMSAQSGALVVEVGGVKSEPINVTIADVRSAQAIGECVYPKPPILR